MKIKNSAFVVLFFSFLCFLSFGQLFGQMIQPYEKGPVHEGFITKISGGVLLDSAPMAPPELITERIPRQVDMQAEWLPGYWGWAPEIEDFVWVSGVWRRPPPGHNWISGFWKKYDDVWAWIPGFWSKIPPQAFMYIDTPPPDLIDEDLFAPPGDNYFWVSGFWSYVYKINDYQWMPGYWDVLDPDWVLVPAHYVWLPKGYVFVPAYWDWPLELRGTAYYPVIIEAGWSGPIIFEPMVVFEPTMIIERLFLNYPDYFCFFRHHFHFHNDFWNNYCCMPPWWAWDTWWGFSWHDHWGLWWWYSHPGFPQPFWMNVSLADMIAPPMFNLFSMFAELYPPLFILEDGVVDISFMFDAIKKVTGKKIPLLPADKKQKGKIFDLAKSKVKDVGEIIKPSGKKLPLDPRSARTQVKKPFTGKDITKVPTLKPNLRPKLPQKPRIPGMRRTPIRPSGEMQPPIRRPTWTPGRRPPSYEPPRRRPPEPRAPWHGTPGRRTPETKSPTYEPPRRWIPETRRPRYEPPRRYTPETGKPQDQYPGETSPGREVPEFEIPQRSFPPGFWTSFERKRPEFTRPNRTGGEFETPKSPPPAKYQPEIERQRLKEMEMQTPRFEGEWEGIFQQLERFDDN